MIKLLKQIPHKEKIVFYSLFTLMVFEMVAMYGLVYFARFEDFVVIFISGIKFLTPLFVFLNLAFILFSLIVKGASQTFSTWKEYLFELLLFFFVSFLLSVGILLFSVSLGVSVGAAMQKIYHHTVLDDLIIKMREYVQQNIY